METKCNVSIGRVISTDEGTYYAIKIQNRKEKIDIEVKMNAEQFANLLTGQMIMDAELKDRIKKEC